MKRVVLVHCWEGYPNYCWYPSVKKDLEEKGYIVSIPVMPETAMPKMSVWVPTLQDAVGEIDEDLCLVGHSIGCATILRFLESLPTGKRVGAVVLVAGFTDNLGFDEIQSFFDTPFDFQKIKQSAKQFTAIASDNDPFVPLKHAEIFKKELGAQVIIKHNMKHFSGPIDNEESCTRLPDVTEAITQIIR